MKRYNNTLTRYIFFLLAFALLFGSCTKDIEFKGEVTKPLLVVNSIADTDSPIWAHVSQSRFTLGKIAPIPDIEHAVVSVYVNGVFKEKLLHKGSGLYKGDYRPLPSDEVRIEVSAPQFDKIEGTTVLPNLAKLEVAKFTTAEKDSSIGKVLEVNMRLVLSDDPQQENYYFIKLLKKNYNEHGFMYENYVQFKLKDVLENKQITAGEEMYSDLFGSEGGSLTIENIFTDELVNGKEIGINSLFHEPLSESDKWTQKIEYEVQIAQMSRDLFLYIMSADKASQNEGSPLVEPVQIHSNMSNGVGILGSYTVRKIARSVTLQ